MHLHDAAHPLGLARESIENHRALLQATGVNPGEGEGAVLIVHDLEGQGSQGPVGIDHRQFTCLVAVNINLRLRRNLGRVGKIVDYCVQNQLHPLVLEGRSAEGRVEGQTDGSLTDEPLERLHIRFLPFQILLHRLVVLLHRYFDQFVAVVLHLLHHVGRRGLDPETGRVPRFIPDPCLPGEEINHSRERVLDANRQSHHHRLRCQHILDLLNHAVEIGTNPVQLVHQNETRHRRFIRITPVGLGLGLHPTRSTKNPNAPIKHLERTINLNGEVHVPRSINDVKLMVVPETGGGRRLNRDPPLLFLLHEIRGGGTIVHLPDLVDLPRELENALRGSRLSRIDVRKNAYISVFRKVSHG